MKHPNLFHFPNGYAAMGFGVPVAIGMKVGAGRQSGGLYHR